MSPQIIENWRRGSADGLSLQFIIIWLAGDVFNIWGAVLQGVLPTMIILAVYYTIADIVLLGQCFYYRGFTWKDEVRPPPKPAANSIGEPNETTGLLPPSHNTTNQRRRSSTISAQHLSPVVPLLDAPKPTTSQPPALANAKPTTALQTFLFNFFSILLVCIAGVVGWYISNRSSRSHSHHHHQHEHTPSPPPESDHDQLSFSYWGQIFGYLCAILYLGSRIPQLLLNYRRKSTSGISMLFFLFACIGNLTYVLSIFAYEAPCARAGGSGCESGQAGREYGRYIAVNASWLVGSAGTLFLDAGVFVQFFLYGEGREEGEEGEEEGVEEEEIAVGGAN
ncbi:PQ loop repeat protein [Rutstroemia sp. NJR-2017a BVV2]|nr:PQ loop repeat protein [Rutstroemia sp. NJR-2017a BVV2]